MPALSTQEETEDAIREAGELFALIRRDEWSLRLALAGEFLALMARIGARGHAAEQDLAEMAPAAVARECWMVEIQFGEPGEGAWIEYDEGQRLYCLKPGFGITVGPDGGVLGVSVIEAF